MNSCEITGVNYIQTTKVIGNCKLTINSIHSFIRVVVLMVSIHSNITVTKSHQSFVHFIKALCLPVTDKKERGPSHYSMLNIKCAIQL